MWQPFALLALLAAPAMAEDTAWPIPWDGFWVGADYADCGLSDRYQGAEIIGETLCRGLSAEPLIESGWLVQMHCDDEGRVWTAPRLVMLDGDRMFHWFGPGGLGAIELLRCATGGDH